MFKKVLAVVAVAAAAGVAGMLGLAPLAAQQGPSATRSFDETPVAPGGDVVVTITAANYGQLGGVTESWPGGLTYAESSLDDSQVTIIDDVTARFTLQGETSFTYTLTAPTEPGTYDGFSGTLRDEDRNDYPVGGDDDTVTVVAPTPTPTPTPTPDPSAPRATRSFDETPVAPGGDVVVTITAANYGQLGGVTESWPDGLTYASSSLRDSQVTIIDDVTARFTLQDDASFTYTLTAPTEPGTYDGFSGTLRDEDRNDHPVGGDDTVTVAAATPTPTPTVAPEEPTPTTDTVMVTNVRIGRVRETLITLSWDALDGAAEYKVQWKSGSLDWSEGRQLETSSTAITLRRLKPATEYSVRVSATDVGTWSEPATASTEGPDDDTGSPFPTPTPIATPTATPTPAVPPTPIPPTTMIATSTAATLMSADGTVTLELPADARSEAYQVNFESVSGCAYAGAKADVTFTCVKALIFDAADMLETDVAFDAAPTISFQLSAEQVKALGGEFLLTKLHEMGGLMIITRASDDAAWTALAGTTLTIDDETGGAVLAGWPSRVTSFTAVADQAAYDAIQEMYAHLLPRPMLAPPTGGPSIPGVALLALLLGSVALLSAGWILTARRSGA